MFLMNQLTMQQPTFSIEETRSPNLGGERVVEGIHCGWLMRDHLGRYEFAANMCRGLRVLDVATGTGYGANILRARGAAHVVAVDAERGPLDYAAKRYGRRGLEWVQADACQLPFERPFDAIVSFETVEHLKQPERFVQECKRLLEPKGTFIISTPLRVGGPFASGHNELEFSREKFEALLRRYFDRVELFGQRRRLSLRWKPLGDIPNDYWHSHVRHGWGSHRVFTCLDRINNLPSHMAAWMTGCGDAFRSQIRPIDAPLRQSPLLQSRYYVMIAKCSSGDAS
jgi:2-polyprenyl-3-methyl-5-hydroxy-6-metoxy-1,4-benzoquinol methylase